MLASGDWVVPRLNGIQYLEKPPLQYWGTAALYAAFGTQAWVSRLWTTGLGFAGVLLVWHTGRRLYGARAGLDAALVLASAPLYFISGHLNTLDMGLCFLLTLALVAFLAARRAAPGSARERHAMWLAWLAIALATLQKGLVALAMPALALALYALIERDFALWRRLRLGSGVAIVLAANLPWWMAMQRRNPQFLEFFFVHEHFTRFATTEHQRNQPWWFFSAVLLVGALPWIEPAVRGVIQGWRTATPPPELPPEPPPAGSRPFVAERFLVAWAAAIFIFYSPSGSKLAPYILPMMPPLALLASRPLGRGGTRALRSPLLLAALFALALLLAGPLSGRLLPPGLQRETYLAVGRWAAFAGAVLALATLAAAWLARRGAATRAVSALGVGSAAALALLTFGTNALEPWRGGPSIATRIAPYLAPSTPFYCVGMYPQTLTFALRRTCIAVAYHGELEVQFDDGERNYLPTYQAFAEQWRRAPRAVAVVDPQAWPDLQALGIPATILASEPTAMVIARPAAEPPEARP
jgi:4-amino-4-deoxy-L-arabinose transferase-like glycosyltransferase